MRRRANAPSAAAGAASLRAIFGVAAAALAILALGERFDRDVGFGAGERIL